MFRTPFRAAALAGMTLTLSGCSIKRMAINSLGDALSSGSSSTFAKDDDPELVRDAIPFALKTIESLIDASPRHQGLLTAAASGFTQYGFAFIQQEADFTEAQDLDRATQMRQRAKRLYLRASDYGLRGLELDIPGFRERIIRDADATVAKATRKDVPLLYWTAAAWGAALAIDVNDAELAIRQTAIEKMMHRALVLDESFEMGALHDFFITWEAAHASAGGSVAKAREHFARATQLADGRRAAPYVGLAEAVSITENNKKEFESLLKQALAVDINKAPEQRLANVINQRRARWLLSRIDDLFVD
ncbi:MAG TPA: TRAP transporter TatT component family protein [Gemmatimonadaceae bacterium]|jgi:predicted anti-sigma-YlaC factor YlaD